EDVARLQCRGIAGFVSAQGGGFVMFRKIVTMGEVYKWPRTQVGEQLRTRRHFQIIPTHMRHAQAGRESPYGTGEYPEPPFLRRFFARFEQRMHAQANSKKRHARPDAFD